VNDIKPGDLVICWGNGERRGKRDVGVVVKKLLNDPNDYHIVLMPDGKMYHYIYHYILANLTSAESHRESW